MQAADPCVVVITELDGASSRDSTSSTMRAAQSGPSCLRNGVGPPPADAAASNPPRRDTRRRRRPRDRHRSHVRRRQRRVLLSKAESTLAVQPSASPDASAPLLRRAVTVRAS
ncbi:hypothetical protein DN523_17810 [Burkholderia multivorans]|nr:hypothetical protein DN470_04560 [Burkholderia multivorans]RAA32363.1 hypothetical protein DN471_04120 [Burkholderia multivorans]RAA37776.1 hypothetical protein DN465_05285 [Burkholderia multivorans]RAA44679.1 hypothetical protein DN472_12955 [Burkholderia multivorans]RAA50748.1 hypothetical protein DN500_02815 [Burkholderia multivorans]